MELSNSNIIFFFLYFLKRKLFLYFPKWNPAHFSLSLKNKRIPTREIFLILQETEILKKIVYTFSKESCCYVLGNRNLPKKFCILGNGTFLIFQETETLKNFLYFRK